MNKKFFGQIIYSIQQQTNNKTTLKEELTSPRAYYVAMAAVQIKLKASPQNYEHTHRKRDLYAKRHRPLIFGLIATFTCKLLL